MNFELVGCLNYGDLKRVCAKGQVYTANDSEREEILSLVNDSGEALFREVVEGAVQVVEEEKKPVAKTAKHPPPNAKKTIQIGKKAVAETPKPEAKAEKVEEEKPRTEPQEPDAVI